MAGPSQTRSDDLEPMNVAQLTDMALAHGATVVPMVELSPNKLAPIIAAEYRQIGGKWVLVLTTGS